LRLLLRHVSAVAARTPAARAASGAGEEKLKARRLTLTTMPLPATTHERTSANEADPPWLPDVGDGRYQNPVLFADYSDPDAIRVGDDYWLTSSSFNHVPGL